MVNNPSHEIVSYLRTCLPEMITLVQQLAEIESPSTVPESQHLLLARLSKVCERFNYTARHIPGRQSGGHFFAQPLERRHQQPVQLLIGHSDTVWPIGTLKEMPIEVGEGVIRGPGVYDMKGGLVQMLYALQALHALRLEPTVTPLIFINSDEEIGSRESTPHIRRLARIADRAFVLEPSLGLEGKLKIARKGVGSFTVVAKGKAAHAGLNPDGGASAILELSFVIQKLFALNDANKGITVNVGMIDGGLRPNVIAPESRAQIDVRVQTREDAKRVEESIHSLQPTTPGVTLEITGSVRRQPMEQTPRNLALLEMAQAAGRTFDVHIGAGAAGGASDGNTTSLFTATLDGLGAVGDGAHAQHEFLYFDKMVERSALLALLLLTPPVRSNGSVNLPG
ncbi:MAG: M20 family metallopeptidase [Deltaproteobacteria bacterium]|nr:M20 family metallopeptidase [Deltaproteobacteria bacterium]